MNVQKELELLSYVDDAIKSLEKENQRYQFIINDIQAKNTSTLFKNSPDEAERHYHQEREVIQQFQKLASDNLDRIHELTTRKINAIKLIKLLEENDYKISTIMKLRYVANLNWSEVSEYSGYSRRHVTRLHKKGIELLKNKIMER